MGSFIHGIEENYIRQRLLEFKALTLDEAVNKAEILTRAHDNEKRFEEREEASKSIAIIDTTKEKEKNNTDEHCGLTTN